MTDRLRLIGLFPALDPSLGGIQVSGRIAWDALNGLSGSYRRVMSFQYGRNPYLRPGDSRSVCVGSKLAAVLAALRGNYRADMVLVWHLSLLQLLPFFGLRDARVMVFLHGVESWRRLGRLARRLLERVDLFLTNSEYTWGRFLSVNSLSAEARHIVVPLGIGVPTGAPPVRPVGSSRAIMIGRMLSSEDYKGHRELLSAWPLVVARVPGVELWIAGEGDLLAIIEKLVSDKGLRESVRIVGRVSEKEKEELLTKCRCLAMPSRGEGFGLVYLEAMRLGRPCLVSTHDAGQEVVNPPEAGLAVDPTDRSALADALVRLLTPGSEWDAWSRQARRRYASQYTAAHFQQRLMSTLFPAPAAGLG